MDSVLSSSPVKIQMQLLMILVLMAVPARAGIKGYFECIGGSQGGSKRDAVICSSNDLPRVNNGSFDCLANSNLSKGGVCPLTCQDGFYPASAKKAVCQTGASNTGGVWSNETFACNEITCSISALGNVLNGSFNCTEDNDVTVNDNCTLVCDNGFYPAFSKEAVCEARGDDQGGKWSEGNFACRAIVCQDVDLPSVESGYFNCSGYSVGDKCNLTCDNGYYPSLSKETVCEEKDDFQGNWTARNFTCSEIKCFTDDLPNITNGTVHCLPGNVAFEGGMCNVTCADGFYTFPSSQTVCRAGSGVNGGEWFPDDISCRPFECTEWNEWNGNEYKLYHVSQSWTVSNTSCVDNNAQLVTIRNEEEQDFVHKLGRKCGSRKDIWIGLRETVGSWQWIDQTHVAYKNWGSGQPEIKDDYDCAFLHHTDGQWYNLICNKLKYSVCKK